MAAIPATHITNTAINAIIIRIGGMFQSIFSVDVWKSIAFAFTVIGWTSAILVTLSAIIVYVSKTNIEALKEAPRTVYNAPTMQPRRSLQTVPITVIAFGYGEPIDYADSIIDRLTKAGFVVRKMRVGFRTDAPSGLTVVPNGHDAVALMQSLNQAGLKYSVGQTHHIPLLAAESASDSVVLEVGAK
jgi:hypothetical protein